MLQNRNVSLKNRYRYFVRDYDLKQYVKTFFKRPAVFVFLKETRLFLGRSQLRNHGEGLRGLQPSHLENGTKKQAFKRVLDLNLSIRRAERARQFNSFNDSDF